MENLKLRFLVCLGAGHVVSAWSTPNARTTQDDDSQQRKVGGGGSTAGTGAGHRRGNGCNILSQCGTGPKGPEEVSQGSSMTFSHDGDGNRAKKNSSEESP